MELLFVLALIRIVLSIVFSLYTFAPASYYKSEESSDIRQNIRFAADFITQELRYVTHIEILDKLPEDENNYKMDFNFIY